MTRHQKPHQTTPDLAETKAHIFIAGHELLKAAEGVLKYCAAYMEASGQKKSHPNLMGIFSKGIMIARDLGSSMLRETPLKGTAEKMVRHFCDTIEHEIREEKTTAVKKKTSLKRKKK
jgi:hypothetical protein